MKVLLSILPALLVVGAQPLASVTPAQLADARICALTPDDPPPEPASCPLCGGNARLHMQITSFLIERATTRFLAIAVCRL